MKPHFRKLFPLQEDHNPTLYSSENNTNNETLNNSNSSSSSSSSCCAYNNLKLSPPFDSAMALTVLVLLTALFFMGFFSIYIRRFADESSVDPTRRRRGPDNPARVAYRATSVKGVDPNTVKSLPVYGYCGGGAKQGINEVECAICLSEFEEREWIKEIPYCGHVFHVECIDTWLESHVTCPLCRTAKLLVEGHVEEGGKERHMTRGEVEEREVRLVVDGGDTWIDYEVEEREVGPIRGERRSTSCLWCGDRVRLNRSLSF